MEIWWFDICKAEWLSAVKTTSLHSNFLWPLIKEGRTQLRADPCTSRCSLLHAQQNQSRYRPEPSWHVLKTPHYTYETDRLDPRVTCAWFPRLCQKNKKLVHYNVGVSVGMVQRLLYQQPCLMACQDFENYESSPALKYNVLFLGWSWPSWTTILGFVLIFKTVIVEAFGSGKDLPPFSSITHTQAGTDAHTPLVRTPPLRAWSPAAIMFAEKRLNLGCMVLAL